jgi:uncharacterized protein (DUF2235 family)
MTCKLLSVVQGISVFHEAGIRLPDWRRAPDVMPGRGINRQIRQAYGWLASRYGPGDMIILMGSSRRGFPVRPLAGVIGQARLSRGAASGEYPGGLDAGKGCRIRDVRG